MKKLVLAASLVVLTACSAPQQEQLSVMPEATLSTSNLVENKTYTLTSKDVRAAQYVALVDSGRSNIQPIHAKQNMRISLENAIAQQFESQGYRASVNSENSIVLEIQEALVTVKHTIMENQMDGKVTLEVTAETPQGKLVKTFNGTGVRTGTLSASNDDISMVLNDVINLVLADISNDQELQNYMKERF